VRLRLRLRLMTSHFIMFIISRGASSQYVFPSHSHLQYTMAGSEESPFSNFGGRVRNDLLEDEYADFDGSEYLHGSSSRQGDRNRLRKRNTFFKSRANVFQEDKPGSLFTALRRWKPFGKKEEQPESNLMPEDEIDAIPVDGLRDVIGHCVYSYSRAFPQTQFYRNNSHRYRLLGLVNLILA
jgi:hypothetical protein